MRKNIYLIIGFLSLSFLGFSYNHPAGSGMNQESGNVNMPKAAGCSPANGRVFMEFNNAKALIEVGGSMWQDRANSRPSYEIPQGEGKHVLYSGSLWMGGTDINGQLKLAAVLYRADGNDFWAGPLSATPGTGNYVFGEKGDSDLRRDYGQAEIIPEECLKYDKMFSISRAEVRLFITWWECQNGILVDDVCDTLSISQTLLQKIKDWPAHGDESLGQDFYLAPFYDNPNSPNGLNQVYDPEVDGDYPWYDFTGEVTDNCKDDRRITLFGDQTYWWVFNDKGNIHTESGADPIGMEIRAQAFSFATNDEINSMTFYNYELINRSTQRLEDTYFGQFADADVGGADDDYLGCDVGRGLGYAYNGDADDQPQNGSLGYLDVPPSVGIDFFEGPYQDDDGIDNAVGIGENEALNGLGYGDGIVDNERFGMRKFLYFNRADTGPSYSADPTSASHYYNYLRGFWKDGSPNMFGGTGHQSNTPYNQESDFMFPGTSDPLNWGTGGVNPDPNYIWAEDLVGNQPGDRRFVQSAGPFVLEPGAVNNITVGVVFGQRKGDLQASVEAMKVADTKAQALFDACFQIVEPPHAPNLSARELENKAILFLTNPANSNNAKEDYFVRDRINIITPDNLVQQGIFYDDTFRFEGYQIYQLKDESVSIQDIDDESKARLVSTVDLNNGIESAVNYVFDEELGFSIPSIKFQGKDDGLKHSFEVTSDLFATGANKKLINHKKYYYIAVAFAFNEYKEYDPNDATKIDGQKLPYLRSRISANGGEIRPITVIPHKPSLENGGTLLGADYGDGPILRRIDGEGNGGHAIEITQETEDLILASGSVAEPEYKSGLGPVNIKVVDPMNVVPGQFEFRMTQGGSIDTADWYIVNLASNDTVYSDTSINVGVEKLILDWGISVTIKQFKYIGSGNPNTFITEVIDASINYQDSSKLWLSAVADDDRYFPTNWIRSGTFVPEAADCSVGQCLTNACNYPDASGIDNDQTLEGILGGSIAPFRLVGYSHEKTAPTAEQGESFCPTGLTFHIPNFFSGTSGATFGKARVAEIQSVDIVYTSDKSLWTRCPVIEMGVEPALNENQVGKLRLRAGQSVDVDGNPDNSGTGMGWFPGYAINMETGERLNMAFGENSSLPNNNGRDMIWNPTSEFVNSVGNPIFGGMHYIYVFNTNVDNTGMPAYDQGAWLRDKLSQETGLSYKDAWTNCMYVGTPMLADDQELLATDVRIKLRVAKEYTDAVVTGRNNGRPMYTFDLTDLAPRIDLSDTLGNELIAFRAVPNPYYGYSEYEADKLDTRIKIVDIPQTCKISIFNVSGSLVKTIDKDDPLTSSEWDLKNNNGIPVAGGLYIIHVETPDGKIGITKWFGAMRPPNLENF